VTITFSLLSYRVLTLHGKRDKTYCNPSGPRTGVISVVEIKVSSRHEIKDLIDACYDISDIKNGTVTIYASAPEVIELTKSGYNPVEIEKQSGSTAKTPYRRGLGVYHSYEALTDELKDYAKTYPEITKLVSLGESVEGRKILAIKITDNPDIQEDEPEFKYVSTMHGDEIIATEMCIYFIDLLLSRYGYDERITHLVDSVEIWIVPLMNPDGYERRTRYNSSGYDLNRNFPENYPANDPDIQPETRHIINWSEENSFVLSANFHSGALCVNYPYDYDGSYYDEAPTPDDALFKAISRKYSFHNTPMWNSSRFPDGITNGADWYVIRGGMQDWNYRFAYTNEVTIELSDTKIPPEETIPSFWNDNRDSMLAYLEASLTGIRGIVTDSITGSPLLAAIYVRDIDHPVFTDPDVGDFHRLLLPGTYTLEISADGYISSTIPNIEVSDGPAARIDVALEPLKY